MNWFFFILDFVLNNVDFVSVFIKYCIESLSTYEAVRYIVICLIQSRFVCLFCSFNVISSQRVNWAISV